MKLYERDYCKLSHEETLAWQEVKQREDESAIGPPGLPIKVNLYAEYPKAARHSLEIFPNNFLDPFELHDRGTLEPKVAAFERLLNNADVNERAILNHIREQQSYFVIGSILKSATNFGHHAAFLFPEFPLATSHRVDYLVVGKNSGGHHFVFVELEAPKGGATRRGGKLAIATRRGLEQVADWKVWIERNYSALQEVFEKHRMPGEPLPEEFFRLDTSRLHYFVVAGRRSDFESDTYRIARELNGNLRLIHYDNLIDSARAVIGADTY